MADNRRRQTARPTTTHNVEHLGKAREDAKQIGLTAGQICELEEVVHRLEKFGNKRETWDLPIAKVDKSEEIYALEHTGTSFGRTVVEVYFAFVERRHEIVVLGVTQGSAGAPRKWYRLERMRNRLAHYLRIVK